MKSFALLTLVCGLLLGTLNSITRETIIDNRRSYALEQLRSVINYSNENISDLGHNVYALESAGKPTGFIFAQSTSAGYNGTIESWIAVDTDQSVRGVRVFKHQETPGIGDKIELSVSDWVKIFDGTSLEENNWSIARNGGDFDHFSGATITSRAMIDSVKAGLETTEANFDIWKGLADAQKTMTQIEETQSE
jgi:electron transport complex protein RnfG